MNIQYRTWQTIINCTGPHVNIHYIIIVLLILLFNFIIIVVKLIMDKIDEQCIFYIVKVTLLAYEEYKFHKSVENSAHIQSVATKIPPPPWATGNPKPFTTNARSKSDPQLKYCVGHKHNILQDWLPKNGKTISTKLRQCARRSIGTGTITTQNTQDQASFKGSWGSVLNGRGGEEGGVGRREEGGEGRRVGRREDMHDHQLPHYNFSQLTNNSWSVCKNSHASSIPIRKRIKGGPPLCTNYPIVVNDSHLSN